MRRLLLFLSHGWETTNPSRAHLHQPQNRVPHPCDAFVFVAWVGNHEPTPLHIFIGLKSGCPIWEPSGHDAFVFVARVGYLQFSNSPRTEGQVMPYLQPSDYPNYGLPAGTTADWITAATALINSYCRRPDLNVIQYTERLRVTTGPQTVLLSYLPLAPLAPPHRPSSVFRAATPNPPRRAPHRAVFRNHPGLRPPRPMDLNRSHHSRLRSQHRRAHSAL